MARRNRRIIQLKYSNLDRIEILPEYREKGYGKLITKDILLRLNSSYGIAILKAFPLQLEVSHPNSSKQDSEWNTKMNFKQMEQDSNMQKNSYTIFIRKWDLNVINKVNTLFKPCFSKSPIRQNKY